MITVTLPTLHTGQVAAYLAPGRFKAIRCGRRWGKTILGECVACDAAIKGKSVGIFAPDYKIMAETYHEVIDIIEPVKRSSSRIDWVIRTITGGRIDFWTLENERAGRSRGYDLVIIDEAAFAKPNMMKIWETAIQPTLLEHRGEALVLSNTNGNDPENFFWRICNQPEHGFTEYYAPSSTNPYLPMEELEELRRTRHPQVFAQEYLAEFVDWAGVQFFSEEHLLVNGQPVDMPARCDSVFAVIDTALKSGKEHDGTAASYWAFSSINPHPLICLDWDLIQVDGAVLEAWLPSVFANLERLARETRARGGSGGVHIEDTGAGTVLIQQGAARGLNVHAIDSKLTAMGKDERAFNTSGYVFQNKVKLAAPAFHKTSVFKGQSKNHFLAQVLGFRIADKKAATRADDLLDTMTYAVALALGNADGF